MISAGGPAPRKHPSWIDAFCEYTEGVGAPLIFRRWSAISAIAGAMERKTWVRSRNSNLYPNMYNILVGAPGVGKTMSLAPAERLWNALPDHHTAPTSLTKAALIDALNDAKRRIVRPGQQPPYVEFNSLLVLVGELGVFMASYDSDFMNVLTAIYDGYQYAERRRTKDLKITIDAPQLNILGATTPSYLNSFLPEGAWDQGFLSRTMLIYSGEKILPPLFEETDRDENFFKSILADLKQIGDMFGRFEFTPEAGAAVSAWHQAGGPPAPDHPKLTHYITRRTAHVLKLCMVASAAESNDRIITLHHYQTALSWILDAEAQMPDIFRSMNTGGDARAIEEAWHFIYHIYIKEKRPVAEHRLIRFLQEKVPSHSVERIVQVMVKSQILKQDVSSGVLAYVPAARRANA